MSDYLSKPLDLQTLAQALKPWTNSSPQPQPAPHTEAQPPWLDETRWASFMDLDDANGSLRREIMDEFLQTLSSRVQAIEHAAALQRFEEVQQAAHHLQGAAANVGAMRLAAACEAVESSARHQVVVSAELAWLAACEQGTRRAFTAS